MVTSCLLPITISIQMYSRIGIWFKACLHIPSPSRIGLHGYLWNCLHLHACHRLMDHQMGKMGVGCIFSPSAGKVVMGTKLSQLLFVCVSPFKLSKCRLLCMNNCSKFVEMNCGQYRHLQAQRNWRILLNLLLWLAQEVNRQYWVHPINLLHEERVSFTPFTKI